MREACRRHRGRRPVAGTWVASLILAWEPSAAATEAIVVFRQGDENVLLLDPGAHNDGDEGIVLVVDGPLAADGVAPMDRALLDRLDRFTAPRLTEFWELDPCSLAVPSEEVLWASEGLSRIATYAVTETEAVTQPAEGAPSVVAGHAIELISGTDENGLRERLAALGIDVPAVVGARGLDESARDSTYLVIDAMPVPAEGDTAPLRDPGPLRIRWRAPALSAPLPIPVGGSQSPGDVAIIALVPETRVEAAGLRNVTAPTMVELSADTVELESAVHGSLVSRLLDAVPGTAVTEHVGELDDCDPCATSRFERADLPGFGWNIVPGEPTPTLVASRLHLGGGSRNAEVNRVLLAPATAIAGGRGAPGPSAEPATEARPADRNRFDTRYLVRYPWDGAIPCEAPRRGRWGGPNGLGRALPRSALQPGARLEGPLEAVVAAPVPSVGLEPGPGPDAPVARETAGGGDGSAAAPGSGSGEEDGEAGRSTATTRPRGVANIAMAVVAVLVAATAAGRMWAYRRAR